MYEYGIMMRGYDELHRGPMTEQEALDWMQDCVEAFPNAENLRKVFWIVRRPVGEWERYGLG